MLNLAARMLSKEKNKTILTILSVGVVLMLIMFLAGIYEGVRGGATGYVANSSADLWICQKNSTNLLRSSSFLSSGLIEDISRTNGVNKVEGILRIITTANIQDKAVTLFVFGIAQDAELAKPLVVEGGSDLSKGEIIIDVSFAKRNKLKLNSRITIQNREFLIIGFSTGTNATVAQFSFITLEDSQELLGFENIVSFLLVKSAKENKAKTLETLAVQYAELAVFEKKAFIGNTIEEMETGVLPILFTIAILGFITGGLIITLVLYSSIVERREDYALMKALGMSQSQITFLVMKQSVLISFLGFGTGLVSFAICSLLLKDLMPEINVRLTGLIISYDFLISVLLGTTGSLVSIKKLSSIYPAEVFRA